MDIRSLRRPDHRDDPPYAVPSRGLTFTLWLEFEWWVPEPDDDPATNFFNMAIHLSDGRHYALNVWTFQYLQIAHRDDQASGKYAGGPYLLPPDLFVTTLDRPHLVTVVTDLIHHDHLREEWRVIERAEDTAEETVDDDETGEDPIFARLVQSLTAENHSNTSNQSSLPDESTECG